MKVEKLKKKESRLGLKRTFFAVTRPLPYVLQVVLAQTLFGYLIEREMVAHVYISAQSWTNKGKVISCSLLPGMHGGAL